LHILYKERLGSGSRTGEIRRRGRGREVLNVLARQRVCRKEEV
jgi:hypothetical protein